ncbi:hypothetical protein ACIBKY_44435 [Nonomuraea sp. NPDC050394]|uniref:hypothetical protein n=1 Tax=Nonomuraea sp. NPDC050394 TaxID=3364363 RepID=UPI0037B974C1
MTALLELVPRDAGVAPPEVTVEFLEGATLHEVAACWITCTLACRQTENSAVPSADDAN